MKTISKYIVTLAGVGFIPYAPGTFGSLIAILFWYLSKMYLSDLFYYISLAIILLISFRLTQIYLIQIKKDDPSEVIIDEFIGQSIPLLFIYEINIYEILLAFAAFRFFDIFKIYPINIAEKLEGSRGVIFDDIIAGIYALVLIYIYKIIISL